jgi:hypothetical protein
MPRYDRGKARKGIPHGEEQGLADLYIRLLQLQGFTVSVCAW